MIAGDVSEGIAGCCGIRPICLRNVSTLGRLADVPSRDIPGVELWRDVPHDEQISPEIDRGFGLLNVLEEA